MDSGLGTYGIYCTTNFENAPVDHTQDLKICMIFPTMYCKTKSLTYIR